MSGRLLQQLGSQRLTLPLMIAITVVATVKTLFPLAGPDGPALPAFSRFPSLAGTFHQLVFLALITLLALNVTVCTVRRFLLRVKARKQGLRARNFLPWMDLVMHCSIVVILFGGAVKGVLGFTGTQYLFVGYPVNMSYDWKTGRDTPLGFAVILRERVEDYYPVEARIGVSDAATGEKIKLLKAQEGRKVSVPGSGLRLAVLGMDESDSRLRLSVGKEGGSETFELDTLPGGENSFQAGEYSFTLVAYRREIRSVRSRVTILEGDRPVREEWLVPNGSVSYKGTNLYQTAWGEDEDGLAFTGIQFSRDPGAPIFWTGSILFTLALPLFLLVRHPWIRGRRLE